MALALADGAFHKYETWDDVVRISKTDQQHPCHPELSRECFGQAHSPTMQTRWASGAGPKRLDIRGTNWLNWAIGLASLPGSRFIHSGGKDCLK